MDPRDQKALELLRDTLSVSEGRMYEHVSTTFRWLMATLFTANGGAIIALLSNDTFFRRGSLYALGWFALGIVLSIVMGALSSLAGYQSASALWAVRMQIEDGLLSGTVPKDAINEFTSKQKPTWKTFIPSDVGIGSLVCFVAGMVAAACSVIQ